MNIGSVLLIGTSNVTTLAAPAVTGTKPEWMPAALAFEAWIGWHGSANVDCVTVWLICENWNCRMSPGLALTSAGVKTSDLLTTVEPTTMGIILDFVVEEAGAVEVALGAVLVAPLGAPLAPFAADSARVVVSNFVVWAEGTLC
jgi:hypothetical protein